MAEQKMTVIIGADIGNFQQAMSTVQKSMNKTGKEIEGAMNGAENSASQGASGIKKALGGIAGVVATAFAVDKIVGWGKTLLNVTADAEALDSQYSQVMGGMKNDTDKYLDEMGAKWNKHPNELKSAYMQYVAILKSKGVAEEEAHNIAKTYLDRTVDANAFANEDMATTTARFMGGIKGEYDSLDTAMVNLSATMLNEMATEQYGKKFDELTTAQQEQLKAQEMVRQHTSAGVFGQGANEADSYANNLAMVKNTWNEMLAGFGAPILDAVNEKLQGLSEWLQKVDVEAIKQGFSDFGNYMSNTFSPLFSDVKTVLTELWDAFEESGALEDAKGLFEGFKDVLAWIKDNSSIVTGALFGLVGAFVAFNIITGINKAIAVFNTLMIAMRTGTIMATLAQWGFNTALLANPITWIAVAIGVLIAIIVALWLNWDSVSKWLSESWTWIKDVASKTWSGITKFFSETWEKITDFAKEKWSEFKNYLSETWTGIKEKANSIWQSIKNYVIQLIVNLVRGAIEKWQNLRNNIQNIITNIKDKITTTWENIKTKTSTVFESVKEAIQKPIEKARDIVQKAIEKIKGFFTGLKLELPSIKVPKLPKFEMSGKFGLNPPSVPKLKLKWNQDGAIVRGTKDGTIAGLGENFGDEAIVPLSNKSRMKPFAEAVASMMPFNKMQGGANGGEYNFTIPLFLDGKQIAKGTAKFTREELEKLDKRNNRMGGVI